VKNKPAGCLETKEITNVKAKTRTAGKCDDQVQ
jgi:hypothetical protein